MYYRNQSDSEKAKHHYTLTKKYDQHNFLATLPSLTDHIHTEI
jgi:hypothetical protein